ncbi:MAG: hypothetical protein SCK28_09130 [Bacillota bacterium]|nr:hypothetical protein [Bacillota bacterium]
MNKKNTVLLAFIAVILVFSLTLNIFLTAKYTDLAKRQNTVWSNTITLFSKVINWASISNGDLASDNNNDKNQWEYRLGETKGNLGLVREHLENMEILPYAEQIFPWENREKIRLFINYNLEVVGLMEKELKEKGVVSIANKERAQVIHNTWEEILRVLETERNKRDPFKPVFTTATWNQVFNKAIAVFENVELVPLPEM